MARHEDMARHNPKVCPEKIAKNPERVMYDNVFRKKSWPGNNSGKNLLRASYSVEVSLVMPVAILLVAALLYMSFYLHDRVLLKLCACRSAVESAFEERSADATAKDNIKRLHLLVTKAGNGSVTDQNRIYVTYTGKFTTPFSFTDAFFEKTITAGAEACPAIGADRLRIVKIVRDRLNKSGEEDTSDETVR